MKEFEYFYTRTAMGTLEIEDIGNCVLEASNDEGLIWYIYIKTNLGWTKVVEYGPASPDFNDLPNEVSCTFNRIEYNEKKIDLIVKAFLNNTKRHITQAKECTLQEMLNNTTPILEYIQDETNF